MQESKTANEVKNNPKMWANVSSKTHIKPGIPDLIKRKTCEPTSATGEKQKSYQTSLQTFLP